MPHAITKGLGLVSGRVARVTRLDGCGRPVYGDGNSVVTEGQTSVAYTAVTNDVDPIVVTNSNGKTIVNQPGRSTPSGYGLQIDFGKADPEVISIMTGQDVVLDLDGNVVGFGVDTSIDVSAQGFALELWTNAPGGDACEDEDAEGSYGYVLLPFVTGGTLGDFTIENGAVTFSVTNAATKDGNGWKSGPYDVVLNAGANNTRVAGPLLEPIPSTKAMHTQLVTVTPPEPLEGARPLLRRTDAALVSITAQVTAKTATLSGTPDPAAGVGIWWDFGDGTWDYVSEDGGDTTHTYAASGTYTVQASTNGKWVSTPVTIA